MRELQVFLAIALGAAALAAEARAAGATQPAVARVASVDGEATLDSRPLKPGDAIGFGQVLALKPKAAVKLLTVVDRSLLDLAMEAMLSFSKPESVESAGTLHLDHGQMRASIHPKMSWELISQGIQYTLHDDVIGIRLTDNGTEGKQEIALLSGEALVAHRDDKKVTNVAESSQMILSGTLENGELHPSPKGGIARADLNSHDVRDWINHMAVEDHSYSQQVTLGPGQTARARTISIGLVAPDEVFSPHQHYQSPFEDLIEPFTTRTRPWEFYGSGQQARAAEQMVLGH